MKTLYVTDLDGTLLEPDKSIKPENLKLINQLIDEDVNITYATARSLITAKQVIVTLSFQSLSRMGHLYYHLKEI